MSRALLARQTRARSYAAQGTGTGRRAGVITAMAVAVAAGAAGGGWAFGYGPFAPGTRPGPSQAAIPVSTATVTRGTITASQENSGTLGYDGNFTVYAGRPGTVTWLPAAGAVIHPGQRLFAVDGQSVMLLRGSEPAWREFAVGMTDGPDVRELESNLVALGYDPYGDITIDDHFDWATQAAVERWQAALGVPVAQQNGQIPLGQVAFLPQPVRVAALSTGAGATIAPGVSVFTATSTTPVADISLPADEESLVRPGQPVTVTLPGGSATPGRVLRIDQGVSSGQGSSQGQGSAQGSQSPAAATVTVVVGLTHPSAAAGLGQAPVQAAIATQTERDVLTAPISALLARPGGGFQVTVVTGRSRRNVTVQTGLFDDTSGTVAISGPRITDGTTVEVPSS